MTTTHYEARAQIRAALSRWPQCDKATLCWYRSLHWQTRECVRLVYGERWSQQRVAMHLGVTTRTVRRSLWYARRVWYTCQNVS